MSVATSIADSVTDFEIDRRRPSKGWHKKGRRAEVEGSEASDAESIQSLYGKTMMMAGMIDSDISTPDFRRSSIGGHSEAALTTATLSSFSEAETPAGSPLPTYTASFGPSMDGYDIKDPSMFMDMPYSEDEQLPMYTGMMSTVGPKGPHLFRSESNASTAPIQIPQINTNVPSTASICQTPISQRGSREIRLQTPRSPYYEPEEVMNWSTSQVCSWMQSLGFEYSIIEKFEKNDISGAILIDLKWEDLKELEIASFGKRVELWSEIHHLRSGPQTVLPTPVEEKPVSRRSSGRSPRASPIKRSTPSMDEIKGTVEEARPLPVQVRKKKDVAGKKKVGMKVTKKQLEALNADDSSDGETAPRAPVRERRRKAAAQKTFDMMSEVGPMDSVSVRGLKIRTPPAKVKNVKVAHRHTRTNSSSLLRQSFAPSLDGSILIATTPSIVDIERMPRINDLDDRSTRPSSFVVPSIIASSDVLGPVQGRELRLQETLLREVGRVDPQEQVKQFLTNQHIQHLEEVRASPPPVPTKTAEDMARASAFRSATPPQDVPLPISRPPTRGGSPAKPLMAPAPPAPIQRSVTPGSIPSRVRSPPQVMRTTTPFSEMDVPTSYTPLSAIREQSQSVPPDMRFRRFTPTPASQSVIQQRRRPSHTMMAPAPPPAIPTVDENAEWEEITSPTLESSEATSSSAGPARQITRMQSVRKPGNGARTHTGWMKKRKTNWFRHEWPDYHFELQGTRLGYAKDVKAPEEGYIEMEDFSVACANAQNSKISAALKSFMIKNKKDEVDPSKHFVFQLVPSAEGAKKVKGDKSHCFAVGTREERIDWMRELMLAKALKQKETGYEVEMNGQRM